MTAVYLLMRAYDSQVDDIWDWLDARCVFGSFSYHCMDENVCLIFQTRL